MDKETAVNLKRSYAVLLGQIEKQQSALQEEDIERYLVIADQRDSEMASIDVLFGSPAFPVAAGNLASGLPPNDVAELTTLLSKAIELDRQNGLTLARLIAGARIEMDNMRDSRAMLLGYARALGRDGAMTFDEKI